MIKFKHYTHFGTTEADTHAIQQYIPMDDIFFKFIMGTLTEVTPEDFEGITTLRQDCFYYPNLIGSDYGGCSIKRFEFPDTITDIPQGFMHGYTCDEVIFPSNLSSIGGSVFTDTIIADFSKVTKIPSIEATVYGLNSFQNTTTIKVPSSLYSAWSSASDWTSAVSSLTDKLVAV